MDLRTIQFVMGHASMKSTSRYLHIATQLDERPSRPFVDLLGVVVAKSARRKPAKA